MYFNKKCLLKYKKKIQNFSLIYSQLHFNAFITPYIKPCDSFSSKPQAIKKLKTGCSMTGSTNHIIWCLALGVDCFYTWCSFNPRHKAVFCFFLMHMKNYFFWTTPGIQMQFPWMQINSQCKWSWKLTSKDLFYIFPDSEHCSDSRCQAVHPASFIDKELVGSWSLRKSRVLQINLKTPLSFCQALHELIFPEPLYAWTSC